MHERRKLVTLERAAGFLQTLEDWDVEILGEPERRSLTALAQFARPHQLSAYDAVYLHTAMSLGIALFTQDRNLQIAAKRCGVELIASIN